MKLLKSSTVAVLAAGLLSVVTGCSRDRIEAINLANEGDQSVKVNVEGAIQKYEQAIDLDQTNHRILWKLANAYEKKEDWDKMASTLARAVQVAPDFANYWAARGHALIMQARAGNLDMYKQAQEPLKKCIEKDPNLADCYNELGETYLWTDDEQSAADNYSKAIEHDPSKGYFYPDLANLYLTLKLYDQAQQVLNEGLKLIPPGEKNNGKIYNMYILLSNISNAKGDKAGQVAAIEKAEPYAGDAHPEFSFMLGSTYATQEPPQKEKALRLLNQFNKRVCKGAQAMKFKEECEESNALIQKLGS
ncbi:MAG TPA: tetratricopeptide repeat protein [Polyangiaceae bacterium]|jgi:tetratricopeptide (TPR) repeat protein|nr:tetratricopeptide repeat protein [Polyangiaceae bacterium]